MDITTQELVFVIFINIMVQLSKNLTKLLTLDIIHLKVYKRGVSFTTNTDDTGEQLESGSSD